MLEKAGLVEDKLAILLAKSVVVVETILDDPTNDPFARIAAAKTLMREIIAISPSKAPAIAQGSQSPVIINIGTEPPSPSRKHQAPQAKADGDSAQVPIVIDLP